MKNYQDEPGDTYGRLKVKILLSTNIEDDEALIQNFIDSEPMEIESIIQTTVGGYNRLITTIMYYSKDPAIFKSDKKPVASGGREC